MFLEEFAIIGQKTDRFIYNLGARWHAGRCRPSGRFGNPPLRCDHDGVSVYGNGSCIAASGAPFPSSVQVIAAEGEKDASHSLKNAAQILSESPSALKLRYLQTLSSICVEKDSTIIFPIPMNLLPPRAAKTA